MTEHSTGCTVQHDPEPWVSYTMMTGQMGWRGQEKFKPRESYCQDFDCYVRAREEVKA
jgi:hypothetical protein